MAAKFEIFSDEVGQHRFRLKASNGEIILSSEGYTSISACNNGIESVKTNAIDDDRYDKKETSSDKFFFTLNADNQEVIGTSQSYESASARDNGIASVMENAPDARVEEPLQ